MRMSLAVVRSNSLLLRGAWGQRDMHPEATRADGWCSDGTTHVLVSLERRAAGTTCEKMAGRRFGVYQGHKKGGEKDDNSVRRGIVQDKLKLIRYILQTHRHTDI